MACKDSCCRNKTINVLSKQEELILDLIEQIEDPVVKAQKLSKFHETLVRETSKPEPRIQEPKVDLEKIYNGFTKSKKEVIVNDLQHEIKETKSEVRTLKQELTKSFDQWFKHFKILVITTTLDPTNSDDTNDIFVQAMWEGYFGSSLRVYERKHPFPDLLINYEDGLDDTDRDPSWLSQMFEYGFIRLIKQTSHNQIIQFP